MPTIAFVTHAVLCIPGVSDVVVVDDPWTEPGRVVVAYMGEDVDAMVWRVAIDSLAAGVHFEPGDAVRVGPSLDDLDLVPDVEFGEADALIVEHTLGLVSEQHLHVQADRLMSSGHPDGDVLAFWLDDR